MTSVSVTKDYSCRSFFTALQNGSVDTQISKQWVHRSAHMSTPVVSILHKPLAGRYRPVRVADRPITARCRFIKNPGSLLFSRYDFQ